MRDVARAKAMQAGGLMTQMSGIVGEQVAAGLWRCGASCQLWRLWRKTLKRSAWALRPPFLEGIDARVVGDQGVELKRPCEVSDVQKSLSQSSDGSGGPRL